MRANRTKNQPPCSLAHDLVNKLSTIIGFCDLFAEKAERQGQDEECARWLAIIREQAESGAKHLADHQCELSEAIRIKRSGPQKDLVFY
jgi:hypothetical protein